MLSMREEAQVLSEQEVARQELERKVSSRRAKLLKHLLEPSELDPEEHHDVAEKLILELISDSEVERAWNDASRYWWYS